MPGYLFITAALALLAGGAIGWLVARSRTSSEMARLRTQPHVLREQLAAAERAAQQRLADAQNSHERAQASLQAAWQERAAATEAAFAQRLSAAEDGFTERLQHERLTSAEAIRTEREHAQLRLAEVKADQERLAEQFAALSRQALAANSTTFLEQAEERLKRTQEISAAELAKREKAVQGMVEPLSKTLDQVREQVTQAEQARAAAHGALSEQVKSMQDSSTALRQETAHLVNALRSPQVRGAWGEMQLRRAVEVAGMMPHVDFQEQHQLNTDDGALRPDMVVHLPGDKHVIVDSKVAFQGFLEASEARDEPQRQAKMQAHARQFRTHIDSLSSKRYWDHLRATPEYVVMFVPAESFLTAAMEVDPEIWERALTRNVLIATPATLVALLRTIGFTWRQDRLATDAEQVFIVGRELHKRLATFGKHLTDLGRRLNATVESFNKLNRSIDSNLIPQARRMSALQGLEAPLESPSTIESAAVPAGKSDLYPAPLELDASPQPELATPSELAPEPAATGAIAETTNQLAEELESALADPEAEEAQLAADARGLTPPTPLRRRVNET